LIRKSVYTEKYDSDYRPLWDSFVKSAKNGVFLFNRNYMEYHLDRFQDHSLLFFKDNRPVAVMPANLSGKTLSSHGGLTFGGIVSCSDMKIDLMLDIFGALKSHCRNQGINEIIYKTVPYIYQTAPADEDLYALFSHNARLIARNASSCITLPAVKKFEGSRKDNLRKARKNGLLVRRSLDFASFMNIAQETLKERHAVKPVHSTEEIELLARRFPENIKLFGSYIGGRMLAGLVIYESPNVAHVQYAANSVEGWNVGAQDIIEDYLIHGYYKNKKFFDFGISTESFGKVLNLGLIRRKESFGASAVMYDIYRLVI
jgi:hypothetical protein